MSDESKRRLEQKQAAFTQKVAAEEARRVKARRRAKQSIWLGFGMFGLIGWSVALPTLLGGALGHWLDKHHPGTHSWTLMLLIAGLLAGCVNAWRWVAREDRELREEDRDE